MVIGRGPTGTSSSQDLLLLITEDVRGQMQRTIRQAIAERETGHTIGRCSFPFPTSWQDMTPQQAIVKDA